MRKIFTTLSVVFAMLAFVSCQQEIDNPKDVESIVNGNIPFELVANPESTKTTIDDSWNVNWEDGDIIYAVTTDETWGDSYTDDNDGTTIADFVYSSSKFSTEKTIADGTYTFNFAYTGNDQKSYHRGLGTTHKLASAQSCDASNPLANIKANDALYGQAANIATPAGAINVTMKHVHALMKVVLKNKSGEELTINKFEIQADKDIAGVYTISFSDAPSATIKSNGSTKITVDLTNCTIPNNGEKAIYFVIAALNEYTGDITFVATDSEGNTYSKTNSVEKVSFAAGTLNTANFSLKTPTPDYVTLPWTSWTGGVLADFEKIVGVSQSGIGSDYSEANAPYRLKFDTTGDYFIVKTDSAIGVLSIGVKMLGGAKSSSFTIQESEDGTNYTDLETLTIEGSQSTVLSLETMNSFNTSSRYVKAIFTRGSNVGVGPISISKLDTTPSIAANDISAVDAKGVTNAEATYVAKNFTDDVEVAKYDGCVSDAAVVDGTLVYDVAPNYTGSATTGTIVLQSSSDNSITKTINVSQEKDVFTVSATSLELDNPLGSSKTFTVTSTYAFTIENPDSDKLTITPDEGAEGSDKLTITVTAKTQNINESAADNIGDVVITRTTGAADESKTKYVTVTQAKKPIAGTTEYQIQFGTSYNSANIQDYTSTWYATYNDFKCDIVNFNNNNSGWSYIKCGSKKATSVASITTNAAIPEAIHSVTLTIDAVTTTYVNSIKLYVDTENTFDTDNCQTISLTTIAAGSQKIAVETPSSNCYYKLEFDCKQGKANGFIQISKVVYSTAD